MNRPQERTLPAVLAALPDSRSARGTCRIWVLLLTLPAAGPASRRRTTLNRLHAHAGTPPSLPYWGCHPGHSHGVRPTHHGTAAHLSGIIGHTTSRCQPAERPMPGIPQTRSRRTGSVSGASRPRRRGIPRCRRWPPPCRSSPGRRRAQAAVPHEDAGRMPCIATQAWHGAPRVGLGARAAGPHGGAPLASLGAPHHDASRRSAQCRAPHRLPR
jgi:hypothetical protein